MSRNFMMATAAFIALTASAYAAQEAAVDSHDKHIVDTNGKCVLTKWSGPDDCRPKPVVTKTVTDIHSVTQEQRTLYFDFNKATITGADYAKLDSLAAAINASADVKALTIHGFTDQIGTATYNDKLASKRAEAVKAYLNSKSKLQSDVGDIRGIGKSEPTASCKSLKKRPAKIACMAPERRVEVEIKLDE